MTDEDKSLIYSNHKKLTDKLIIKKDMKLLE